MKSRAERYAKRGEGDTIAPTNRLSAIGPEWKKEVGVDESVTRPVGVGGEGIPGVAAPATDPPQREMDANPFFRNGLVIYPRSSPDGIAAKQGASIFRTATGTSPASARRSRSGSAPRAGGRRR